MSEKNKTEEDGRKVNAIKEKIIDLGGAGERRSAKDQTMIVQQKLFNLKY